MDGIFSTLNFLSISINRVPDVRSVHEYYHTALAGVASRVFFVDVISYYVLSGVVFCLEKIPLIVYRS